MLFSRLKRPRHLLTREADAPIITVIVLSCMYMIRKCKLFKPPIEALHKVRVQSVITFFENCTESIHVPALVGVGILTAVPWVRRAVARRRSDG